MNEKNSVLWKIDIEEINNLLPEEYKKKLEENSAYLFTVDMLIDLKKDLKKYDEEMKDNAMLLIEDVYKRQDEATFDMLLVLGSYLYKYKFRSMLRCV